MSGSASAESEVQAAATRRLAAFSGVAAYVRFAERYSYSWISVADLAGRRQRALAPPSRDGKWADHSPAWSPEGDRVAFVRSTTVGPKAGTSSLYVANGDGSGLRLLQHLGRIEFTGDEMDAPAWSPDSMQIAYGKGPLWVVRADGTGGRRLAPDSTCNPDWSPDGTTLVYLVDDDACESRGGLAAVPGHRSVYRINTDGSGRTRLVRGSFGDVAWSRDGTKIAYSANCRVQHGGDWFCSTYVMNVDGTGRQLLVRDTYGCGCVSWMGPEPSVLWNRAGIYATDLSTRKTRTLLSDRFAGSPVGQSLDGATIAVASWDSERIVLVSASGNRLGQVKVPRGWSYSRVQVFVG